VRCGRADVGRTEFSRSPRLRQQVLDDADRNPALVCEPISPSDHIQAVQLLRQRRDKSYSLCDAMSFVVMRRLGLNRVAAFDEHSRQFGGLEVIG